VSPTSRRPAFKPPPALRLSRLRVPKLPPLLRMSPSFLAPRRLHRHFVLTFMILPNVDLARSPASLELALRASPRLALKLRLRSNRLLLSNPSLRQLPPRASRPSQLRVLKLLLLWRASFPWSRSCCPFGSEVDLLSLLVRRLSSSVASVSRASFASISQASAQAQASVQSVASQQSVASAAAAQSIASVSAASAQAAASIVCVSPFVLELLAVGLKLTSRLFLFDASQLDR
jgi:hypothetical protein